MSNSPFWYTRYLSVNITSCILNLCLQGSVPTMITSVTCDADVLPDQSKSDQDVPNLDIDLKESGEQPMQEG